MDQAADMRQYRCSEVSKLQTESNEENRACNKSTMLATKRPCYR